ncbi:hypothetical protein [Paracnuella aquatica]|uniref:hypothetical protein n=1 Tax=Paracnuella aquatica TaxID=2268757 RepID=UPI000DEF3EC7|nr:hypothetical protein [Paracnuella aquatica]RPD44065.1 hypothetical protein DRJ53_18435 [Paracnuella aquatica]
MENYIHKSNNSKNIFFWQFNENAFEILKQVVLSTLVCLISLNGFAQDQKPIPPKPYTLKDFPESKAASKNMKVINISIDTSLVSYKHDVKYITRDGMDLTLQIIEPKVTP